MKKVIIDRKDADSDMTAEEIASMQKTFDSIVGKKVSGIVFIATKSKSTMPGKDTYKGDVYGHNLSKAVSLRIFLDAMGMSHKEVMEMLMMPSHE